MKLNDPSDPRIIRPSGGDSRHKMPAATPADRGLSASRNASEVVRNMLRKVSSNYASLTLITRRKHLILLAISVLTPWCSGLGRRKQNSRNDAVEFRVERATGPFCRATRPTAVRTTRALNGERSSCVRLGGRLPPRTGGSPVPPRPTAWVRLSEPSLLIAHRYAVRVRQDACPATNDIVPA